MARKTHTVVSGDTLWALAARYLGAGSKYQQIANWNSISNPDLIYVGQVLYVEAPSSGSSGSSTSSSNTITITAFGVRASNNREMFATWTWSKESQTDRYEIAWEYLDGDGVWYTNSSSNSVDSNYYSDSRQSTFGIPDGATYVRFAVKPVSKTKKDSNGNETVHWTAAWSSWRLHQVTDPLATPPAPDIELDDNNKLTATVTDNDLDASHIKFEVIKDDSTSFATSSKLAVNNYGHVSYSCTVTAGSRYKVRCRGFRGNVGSDWSEYSETKLAYPSKPASLSQCRCSSKEGDSYSVYLEWERVASAESYDIEYTTKREYFDNPTGDTTTVTFTPPDKTTSSTTIHNLTGGEEYFFRVRATNETGSSDWSEIKSVVLGTKPGQPTTWSSSTTNVVGEPLTLYWVHNTKDGSREELAKITITVGSTVSTLTLDNDGYYSISFVGSNAVLGNIKDYEDEEEKDLTRYCVVDTSALVEGATIKWDVRTKGLVDDLSESSITREINVYAEPTLVLKITDVFTVEDNIITPDFDANQLSELSSFPFYLKAVAGPDSEVQHPISYHVSIKANTAYETVDALGNDKTINAGEEVYSKHFDISSVLLVEFHAGNIDLENNVDYTITCTVSMSSGLTAVAQTGFSVTWEEATYQPNAEITIDKDVYSASIRPYCEARAFVCREVTKVDSSFVVTDNVVNIVDNVYTTNYGDIVLVRTNGFYCMTYYSTDDNDEPIREPQPKYYIVNASYRRSTGEITNPGAREKAFTTTGEEVLLGTLSDGTTVYYCLKEEVIRNDNVLLSVYRREFDGAFTEIATGLSGDTNVFVTDPHPALDYARYRIVATAKDTGAVSFYDMPGLPVGGKEVVIQWDEVWSSFDKWSEDALSEPPWTGSMIKLPYNIDVSDSNNSDVSHVKYIGRKRPVTYYGTQLGETSSWNVVIPKDDEETIYALRRLAIWMGDVYVREPSGTGYWANIQVSFSQKHRDVTIPVSFSITRVEGGI